MIQKKFGFKPLQIPIFGLDSAYLEMIKGDIKVIVGWDIWSGLFVMAIDEKGNSSVREIGKFLCNQELKD